MVKSKRIKTIISLIAVMSMLYLTTISVFAATVKVNGEEVETGDTITYVLKLEDVKDEKVMGINVKIEYDSDSLEIIKDTVTLPAFNDAVFNLDEEDAIYFNAANISKGYEVTADTIAFSVAFKVLDNAKEDLKIEATIEEIYDSVDANGLPVAAEGYNVNETIEEGTLSDIVKPTSLEEIESSVSAAGGGITPSNSSIFGDTNTIIMIVGGVVVTVLIVVVVILTVKKKNTVGQEADANENNDEDEGEEE